MASMMTAQSREVRALSEKLVSLDFQRSLTSYLANPATCNALFAASNLVNSGAIPFNATSITSTDPYVFALKQIPSGGGAALAIAGETLSPMSNSLKLLPTTAATPGIQIMVASISPPTATLRINFDQTSLVRAIHNLEFPLHLTISGVPGATTITGCRGGDSASSGGTCPEDFRQVGSLSDGTPICHKSCGPDWPSGSVCGRLNGGAIALHVCSNGAWKFIAHVIITPPQYTDMGCPPL